MITVGQIFGINNCLKALSDDWRIFDKSARFFLDTCILQSTEGPCVSALYAGKSSCSSLLLHL